MEDCYQSKIFVGGISVDTSKDILEDHFRRYGNVVGSVIAQDRMTGNPRGFAFVSFSDASALEKVLADTHIIRGRMVEVKRAVPRSQQKQYQYEQNGGQNCSFRANSTKSYDMNLRTKKIFVGGLSPNLTKDNFKFYFEKYGRITDAVMMHDNVTHQPRGFGFITFETEDSVEDVMQNNFHELCGKLVEVKRAIPKEVTSGGTNSGMKGIDFNSSQQVHEVVGKLVEVERAVPKEISSGGSGGTTSGMWDNDFNRIHQEVTYSPRYDVLPSYIPIPGYTGYPYGMFMGGYPVSVYGLDTVLPMIPGAALPMPVYPAYSNYGHGLMGMAAHGHTGIVGLLPNGIPSQLGGVVVDGNSLVSSGMTMDEQK